MSITALSLISRSLRLLGVEAQGETPGANESSEALTVLNAMLDQWSNEKLMIYQMVNELFTITAGTTSYTIGPSGSGAVWETSLATRPVQWQRYAAFIRATTSGTNTDYIMDYYPNDRFQMIFQKGLQTNYPYAWTCDGNYPLATIRIYPNPTLALQMGLSYPAQIIKLGTLTETLVMPVGYENAIVYNLAIELGPEYGIEPSATVIDKARETKFNLKRANQQPVLMTADRALITHGIYSIYGDR